MILFVLSRQDNHKSEVETWEGGGEIGKAKERALTAAFSHKQLCQLGPLSFSGVEQAYSMWVNPQAKTPHVVYFEGETLPTGTT